MMRCVFAWILLCVKGAHCFFWGWAGCIVMLWVKTGIHGHCIGYPGSLASRMYTLGE